MRAMSKMIASLGLALTTACASGGGAAPATASRGAEAPHNLIFVVGDGAGVAYWTAAKFARDPLAVQRMPVVGLVDTRGTDHPRVTDSAAGATAFSTGTRSFNGAVGVGSLCKQMLERDSAAVRRDPAACDPRETLFQLARRAGKAIGAVTTSYVTDATPGAFLAHAPSRGWREAIAAQIVAGQPEVVLGGGRQYFDGSGEQATRELLTDYCAHAACLATAQELAAYRADDRPLLGLFAPTATAPAGQRSPTLPEMTRAALHRLSRDPQGFVLLLESQGPDASGHGNVSLPQATAEMLELDEAVGVALDFAQSHPGTLVVVTADHNTGGLAVQNQDGSLSAAYTTKGHTGDLVPLFAAGPGAERFAGLQENYEVGRKLQELVR